ncbi:unnamed protein product [Leuciscus chuanchicus]
MSSFHLHATATYPTQHFLKPFYESCSSPLSWLIDEQKGERQASVIKVEPMVADEDDEQHNLTEHTQQEACEHLEADSSAVTTVEMLKTKIQALEEKVESLTEERNFLRERLEDVRTPEESVLRYHKVLRLVKSGSTKTDAYNSVGVDRNTIVNQAPIAELAAVSPDMFKLLRAGFQKGDKCLAQCILEPNAGLICAMKQANDLLDILKK